MKKKNISVHFVVV